MSLPVRFGVSSLSGVIFGVPSLSAVRCGVPSLPCTPKRTISSNSHSSQLWVKGQQLCHPSREPWAGSQGQLGLGARANCKGLAGVASGLCCPFPHRLATFSTTKNARFSGKWPSEAQPLGSADGWFRALGRSREHQGQEIENQQSLFAASCTNGFQPLSLCSSSLLGSSTGGGKSKTTTRCNVVSQSWIKPPAPSNPPSPEDVPGAELPCVSTAALAGAVAACRMGTAL